MNSGYKTKSGFTLVEMMVTMVILGVVIAMIGGLTNFVSEKLHSLEGKNLNDAVRQSLNLIAQKMINTNTHVKIGSIDVYGFRYYSSSAPNTQVPNNANATLADPILMIVSSGGTGTNPVCTFFGQKGTSLAMAQDTTCGSFLTSSSLTSLVTPKKVKVTSFTVDELLSQMMTTNAGTTYIPTVRMIISAQSVANSAITSTIDTTFTMDAENVRFLEIPNQPVAYVSSGGGNTPPVIYAAVPSGISNANNGMSITSSPPTASFIAGQEYNYVLTNASSPATNWSINNSPASAKIIKLDSTHALLSFKPTTAGSYNFHVLLVGVLPTRIGTQSFTLTVSQK